MLFLDVNNIFSREFPSKNVQPRMEKVWTRSGESIIVEGKMGGN